MPAAYISIRQWCFCGVRHARLLSRLNAIASLVKCEYNCEYECEYECKYECECECELECKYMLNYKYICLTVSSTIESSRNESSRVVAPRQSRESHSN